MFTSRVDGVVRLNPNVIGNTLISIRNMPQMQLNARQVETAKPKKKTKLTKWPMASVCILRFQPRVLNACAGNTDTPLTKKKITSLLCLAYLDDCSVKSKARRYPALPLSHFPEFLAHLAAYRAQVMTRISVELSLLTFVLFRKLLVRRWEEFDFDK